MKKRYDIEDYYDESKAYYENEPHFYNHDNDEIIYEHGGEADPWYNTYPDDKLEYMNLPYNAKYSEERKKTGLILERGNRD